MKLALAFVCLFLIWFGTSDLAPYRPRRAGRVKAVRRPNPRRRVVRR